MFQSHMKLSFLRSNQISLHQNSIKTAASLWDEPVANSEACSRTVPVFIKLEIQPVERVRLDSHFTCIGKLLNIVSVWLYASMVRGQRGVEREHCQTQLYV